MKADRGALCHTPSTECSEWLGTVFVASMNCTLGPKSETFVTEASADKSRTMTEEGVIRGGDNVDQEDALPMSTLLCR